MSAPYRMWVLDMPFSKVGWPLVGSFGSKTESVVVVTVETFQRLVADHPTLQRAQFMVGEVVPAERDDRAGFAETAGPR